MSSPTQADPAVMIYRRSFLPFSETFVRDHIRLLRRWRPVPVYTQLVEQGPDFADLDPLALHGGPENRFSRLRIYDWGWAPRLGKQLRARGVRLIHAQFLYEGAAIARFAARQRLPLVVTAFGYDATMYPEYQARFGDGAVLLRHQRFLQRYASAFICISEFIRQELIGRGYPPEKLVLNPLGLALEHFEPGGAAGQRRGVLYGGRLVEKKGVERLLRAWALLPDDLRREPLTIIGGGPLFDPLQRLAGELGLEAKFLGRQPREVMLEAMRSHRVFAFPSVRARNGDAEGLGVVALEAQAVGTPVAAFDEMTAREVLSPGHLPLLARPGDTEHYAAQLATLLRDDAIASRLGAEGPSWVAEHFDLHRLMAAREAIYDQVAAQTSPAPSPSGRG